MLNECCDLRKADTSFISSALHRRQPFAKCLKALPATEFGLGIMSEEDVCDGYGRGPSGVWTDGCGVPVGVLDCCCCSVLDGVSAGVAVALLESSSATGEQVSPRTHCANPWRLLPLRLPSLLHSRLEPLRSSFSEELVMVAETERKPEKAEERKW